jgi:hypothetical protein
VARRLSPDVMRWSIAVVGTTVAIVLFVTA